MYVTGFDLTTQKDSPALTKQLPTWANILSLVLPVKYPSLNNLSSLPPSAVKLSVFLNKADYKCSECHVTKCITTSFSIKQLTRKILKFNLLSERLLVCSTFLSINIYVYYIFHCRPSSHHIVLVQEYIFLFINK